MIFTVGWHYTKQVFGCMMVYAYFDKYKFTPAQRTLHEIRAAQHLVVELRVGATWQPRRTTSRSSSTIVRSARHSSCRLRPSSSLPASRWSSTAVFWKNYKERGQVPGVNMVVPFVALYVWWLPITRQYEFYFLLTPFFHSLQYLAFVYKMEDTRLRGLDHPEVRGTILAFSIVRAGWLAFEFVPNEVDTALGTFNSWQMFFFFTAAMLFINIHHYFIDNVLWRFRDPEVQKYLLA
jgi:hypothetical protein